jgi:hypothetical protein
MAIAKTDCPILKGISYEAVKITPSATGVTSIIPATARVVEVQANTVGVNDIIVLPALATVQNGNTIKIVGNSAGFEVRTPDLSTELINNTDSDGTQEYTFPAGYQIHYFTKINNTVGWEAHGFTAIGAAVTAIVPDA